MTPDEQAKRQPPAGPSAPPLHRELDRNLDDVVRAFGDSMDLIIREVVPGAGLHAGQGGRGLGGRGATKGVSFAAGRPQRVAVVHFSGLVDERLVSDSVVAPIGRLGLPLPGPGPRTVPGPAELFEAIRKAYVSITNLTEIKDLPAVLSHLTAGDCVVLVDGHEVAVACSVHGWAQRSIEEAASESTVRGPREGFNETLDTNVGLIRRHIQDPRLRLDKMLIGRLSQTAVVVAYIEGIAPPDLVKEVYTRLERIDIDSVLGAEYIEELIEDEPRSPFPQVFRTERPDRVVGGLLEGRVAIISDGTCFVLVVPAAFTMFLRAAEDYYDRPFIGTFLGLVRFLAFFVSLTLPALYVAITTFHQELLPTSLIFSIAAQREGIPFPALVEALLLEFAFDILREAGIRLPKVIGPTISIIGVLVVGQGAVQAGLVSPFMVVVVAFTGIASYASPLFSLGLSVRILRYFVMLAAGSLGLFGIVTVMSLLLIHLCSLRSFGTPYLAPIGPIVVSELKDAFIRAPWWAMDTRPVLARATNFRRQRAGLRPKPPSDKGGGRG